MRLNDWIYEEVTTLAGSKFRAKMSGDSRKRFGSGQPFRNFVSDCVTLELIFPSPQASKHLGSRGVVAAIPFVSFLFNGCFSGTQERVGALFQGQVGRQRDLATGAQLVDAFHPFGDIGVVRL